MTATLGEAVLEVRAGGTYFQPDINRVVKPGMASAGAAAEAAADRGRRAFSLMFKTVGQNASGAFAPVTDLLANVERVSHELHARSASLRVAAVGAAGVGVGAGLQAFHSQEQAAQQQLQASIEQTGHSYDEYGDQIEKTIKHGEHFGVLAYQTLDVLNRLTVATQNPAKALERYQFVLDASAYKHISATHAAGQLALAYGGNTRALRSLGINLGDSTRLTNEKQKADAAAATAAEKVKKARQNLADVEARIAAAQKGHAATADQLASAEARVQAATASVAETEFRHGAQSPQAAAARSRLAAAEAHLATERGKGAGAAKLTVAQEIELRKAHEAVTAAVMNARTATEEKTKADKAAVGAITSVDDAIEHHNRIQGQAAAAADTWTGHLKALGAELEDQVSTLGGKYGPAVTAVSTGVTALASGVSIATAIMGRWGSAGRAAAATSRAMTAAEETQTAAQAASTEATVALLNAERTLAEVEGQVAAEGPAATAAIRAQGLAAAASAAEFDGLAVSERAAAAAGAAGAAARGATVAGVAAATGGEVAGAGVVGSAGGALIGPAAVLPLAAITIAGMHDPKNGAADIQAARRDPQVMHRYQQSLAQYQRTHPASTLDIRSAQITDQLLRQAYGDVHSIDAATAGKDSSASIVSELRSMHMALLAIQHNTAKGAHNTHDLHATVQHNGRIRFDRSPELATL
jgi:hypothetical protein